MIGNSSSGIVESATLKVPSLNIGSRQKGKIIPKNVVSCKYNEKDILRNIEKVHNPSPEERYLRKLKQETGQSNWWKESSESAEKYVNSDDYASHSESERIERLKEIFGSDIEFDDIADKINIDQFREEKDKNGENPEEDGYIGQGDLDEEGEEFLDD